VLYHNELTTDELEYLSSQRGPMAYRLAQASGLTAELRAEGIALVDVDGELSDKHLPAVGTEAHATLLVAEYLARAAKIDAAQIHSLHELAAFLRIAADQYGRFWRRDAREPGAEIELAREAIDRLAALRLVQHVENGVRPLPALHRYAISEPQI
jgi:uncharacterized protein (TIGR02678 family)